MKLFQIFVFTAVLFANVHWRWIDNGYAAALGAAIVTYCATLIVIRAVEAGFLGRRAAQRERQRAERLERVQ